MMKETTPTRLKSNRILVSLDSSTRGHAALETAVRLALTSGAELQGLFVEDEDLLRLAGLPFAREVDLASSLVRELQAGSMERALRIAAEEARLTFAKALRDVNLQWKFQVIQGNLVNALLSAAGELDLLVVGQRGRSLFGLSSKYLATQTSAERSVVAACDGTPSSFLAVELAHLHATATSQRLSVWVLEKDNENVSPECHTWLQSRGISADLDQVLDPSEDAIVELAKQWRPTALFVSRGSKFLNDKQIWRLINECDCPLILC